MTVIIDDKNKIPFEEYDNPWITTQDVIICSIRQVPLPRIVNNIYKSNPGGDTWLCKNCEERGDKWYLMIHTCKAWIKKEKPKTQLQIQKEEEEIQRRLEASKWTCPYCREVTDRFYERFHYRCIPKNLRNKRENGESDTEICPNCFESISSYYKNFHYPNCKGLNRSV